MRTILSYCYWSALTLTAGSMVVAVPFLVNEYISTSSAFSLQKSVVVYQALNSDNGNDVTLQETTGVYATRVLSQPVFSIPREGSAVFADLAEMMLRVYRDGELDAEYPIASKGKPGSLWETPTGIYAVQTKEENHYSTIGGVWMPHSMQFFGNFFIHGWPEYADGTPVPEGFSGGCIRLSQEDARELFDMLEIGIPVFVANGSSPSADISNTESLDIFGFQGVDSFVLPPAITGKSAIVADLESGYVFYEKNPEEKRSIASLSKLMTALISLEAVNQYRVITITDDDTEVYGNSGGLRKGDQIDATELLWPLLLSSSNDAAYAIARQVGLRKFVELMNKKAESLGLSHTSYKEPSGLDPENQSSALDMFRFVQHIWGNKRSLLEMTEQRSFKTWRNIHPFVSKDSFLGGKTGYIPEANRTIVSLFSIPFGEFSNRTVAVVILGSDNLQSDVDRLRLWVKHNFQYGLQDKLEHQLITYKLKDTSAPSADLSLLFTGDIMLDRGVEQIIEKHGARDWSFPFQYVADTIQNADITFGNLEGPVSDKGQNVGSIYSFRMDPAVAETLATTGFDVVSLANNHMGDWGRLALEDTMRRLLRAGVIHTGAGWNSTEVVQPAVMDARGMHVGFLSFSDIGPNWLVAKETQSGIAVIPAGDAGVSYVEKNVFKASHNVDTLVVSFHFGEEYEVIPTARQIALAHAAVDAGARIVIGHHPHVVQSVEEYKNGVIAYSLGNFVFDQNFSAETMEGLMLRVEFKENEIAAVIPIPVTLNNFYQPVID